MTLPPATERPLDHFRHNLRQLVATDGSIAEACRLLDINRQQMAKYLSGESLPSVPILIKICDHYGVSADIAHKPLYEVAARDEDALQVILRTFLRGPFAPSVDDSKLSSPLSDGYYWMWQPSVWKTGMVAKQLTQVKTIGSFQFLRHCSPYTMANGKRFRTRHYSITFSLGQGTQFVILTFFRRRGVNSWAVSLFREPEYLGSPHLVGITAGAANAENINQIAAARVVLERIDMSQHRLMTLARASGRAAAAEVPASVLRLLKFTAGEFPDILSPF